MLAYHEQKLRQIVHQAGWLEYDPAEIWKHMQECIEVRSSRSYIIDAAATNQKHFFFSLSRLPTRTW